jgi:hypothetical protein
MPQKNMDASSLLGVGRGQEEKKRVCSEAGVEAFLNAAISLMNGPKGGAHSLLFPVPMLREFRLLNLQKPV